MKRDKRKKKLKEKADKKAADHALMQKVMKSIPWPGNLGTN